MAKTKKAKVEIKKKVKAAHPVATKKTVHKEPVPKTAPKALAAKPKAVKALAAAKVVRKVAVKKKEAHVVLPEKPVVEKMQEPVRPVVQQEVRPVQPPVQPHEKPVQRPPRPEATVVVRPAPSPATMAGAPPQKVIPKKEVPPKVAPVKERVELKVIPEVKEPAPAPQPVLKELELKLPITLKDLAIRLQEKPSVLIKALMDIRVMVSINQMLEEKSVEHICGKFGCRIKLAPNEEEMALSIHDTQDSPASLKPRPPIVTFMGHVDHGKTSLLDAIRKTKVAELEHGGITQHIGAYSVSLEHGVITFLDTPGHEAFTAMRARGASITDIVVLVVAADDGVMPQTREAIDHARAAGVTIMVAMNKIDKSQANPDMVKKQLSELNLLGEDWGGKTIIVPVSAKTGQGINELLEMILLEAQMLELKANPLRPAKGVVVEAKLSKGRGPVATLLVKNGTLRLNDNIIVGQHYAKIRAMFNARGHGVREAAPAFPVEILGLSGVPLAGEQFFSVTDEKTAKELALKRQESQRQSQMKVVKRISLEDLHTQIKEGKLKELRLIIKADVQGSLGAIKDTLNKLNLSEIKLDFIHEGVGSINSSDVILAVASNALILGFNVVPDEPAKELIAKEGVDVRSYNVIYELANDIKAALEGMLEPRLKKVFMGKVDVRKVFKLSRSGMVAGCFVNKGKITRQAQVTLVRNGEPIFEGTVASLKRFKDDVREVQEGFECGITLQGYDSLQEGDSIEAFEIEKVARKL